MKEALKLARRSALRSESLTFREYAELAARRSRDQRRGVSPLLSSLRRRQRPRGPARPRLWYSLGRGLRCTGRSRCFWWRDSPTTGRARTRCRPWSSRLCARFRRRPAVGHAGQLISRRHLSSTRCAAVRRITPMRRPRCDPFGDLPAAIASVLRQTVGSVGFARGRGVRVSCLANDLESIGSKSGRSAAW